MDRRCIETTLIKKIGKPPRSVDARAGIEAPDLLQCLCVMRGQGAI
jgi:hypothetical protein